MVRYLLPPVFLFAFFQPVLATTWLIGPGQTYTKPSQVTNLAQNGDTVLIEAGIYQNDVARWPAANLLIRGTGGFAHLKSEGNVYGGKAIWVIAGNDVTIENIEFSEAACPDLNGAGIRSEGINLTIRSCYFHDNENGILAGDISSGDILIEHCEFSKNGYANGQAHNLYINHAHSLTFRYNYSHDAKVGHELKSRAYNNYIYYNRFSDENGTASRSIDLPNGGFSILMGNVIVQDPLSENSNLVGYGLEGLSNPNSELYLVYNTLVNNKSSGSFVQVANGTPLLKMYNNIMAGPGTFLSGAAVLTDTMSNRQAPVPAFSFADPANYDFQLQSGSIAAGIAVNAGFAGAITLTPDKTYLHPYAFGVRLTASDAGAYALPVASGFNAILPETISIFPNPVGDFLEIKGVEGSSGIIVLDFSGKIRLNNGAVYRIDVHELSAGPYLLIFKLQTGSVTIPFVKL